MQLATAAARQRLTIVAARLPDALSFTQGGAEG